MRLKFNFRNVSALLLIVLFVSCSADNDDTKQSVSQPLTIENTFQGWDALTIRNTYLRMDVVPDLGGKIMGYSLQGYQVLWHDPKNEGLVDTEQGYGYGEHFFNPGGAKVWPSPQGWVGSGEWPGPPDDVIDGSAYDYEFDGKIITVTSPSDDGEGRTGLRFSHTYSLRKTSTIADLHLTMTNIIDTPVTWGLWHLATVPVDRQFTIYAPVNKDDWHVIYGEKENPQWLGVEDGLFRSRYDKRMGKVGMKVRDGWIAWHDEENEIAYVAMFPVDKNATYPDKGSNVEIWTNGEGILKVNDEEIEMTYSPETAYMELEVMGPLEKIAPGSEKSLDIIWGVCKVSGIQDVYATGILSEKPKVVDGNVTVKYGTFYGGTLQMVSLDGNMKQLGLMNVMDVSPLTEIIVRQGRKNYAPNSKYLRYQIMGYDKNIKGVLGEVKL